MTTTVYYQMQKEGAVPDTWFDLESDRGRSKDFNELETRIVKLDYATRYRIVKVTREVLDKVY